MFDEENDELMEKKAYNVILLCLDNEVLPEVAKDDQLSSYGCNQKVCYVMKSLTNRLYLKEVIVYFLVDKRMYVH